jgi:hypothetical protein
VQSAHLSRLFCFGAGIALLVAFNLLASATQVPSLRAVAYTWVSLLGAIGTASRARSFSSRSIEALTDRSQISAQLAVDLTITGTIMYGLIKSRTGWSETDKLVKRLVT